MEAVEQHDVYTGLADQQHFLRHPASVQHPRAAQLIRVQAAVGVAFDGVVDQAAQVTRDEPGLIVEQEGTKLAGVAKEEAGMQSLHGEFLAVSFKCAPCSERRPGT